jgi:hypothetical protein
MQWLFYFVPFAILFIVGYNYTFFGITKPFSSDEYNILFASIGITATLSGLTLRASSSADNEKKKRNLYEIGERLLHTTLLFAVVLALRYAAQNNQTLTIIPFLKAIIKYGSFTCTSLLFYYGLIYCVVAIAKLHKLLMIGHEEPFD